MTAPTLAGRVTQARVVRSEWTKFRSLRSSWWTVGVAVILTTGIGVLVSMAAGADKKASIMAADVASRSQVGAVFAQLALGVLAILLISGEYGTGMIRSSMTAVPKRLPVLWGKLAVFVGVILPLTAVTSVVTFLLSQVAWRAHHRPGVTFSDPDVLRIVAGSALYVTVAGIFALAIGALLRNTAAGITVMVGVFFVMPTVMQMLPHRLNDAGRYLPGNAGGSLVNQSFAEHPLAPWTGFTLLCGYAVVVVAAAAWRLRRTDV
jgi:ABC-type transport system involved in multi-copper enzyme maturation permease subunit